MPGGIVFVAAGALDIFVVITKGPSKFLVGVEAQQEQMLQRQVGDIHFQGMIAIICAHFDARHGQVDARHQVLHFDLTRHALNRLGVANGIQAARV